MPSENTETQLARYGGVPSSSRKRVSESPARPGQKKKKTSAGAAGEPKGCANTFNDKQTAMEIALVAEKIAREVKKQRQARDLGIFLDRNNVVLKLAGATEPGPDASVNDIATFKSTLTQAVIVTEN